MKMSVNVIWNLLLAASTGWMLSNTVGTVVQGSCHMPSNWRGQWHESGVGDVIITATNISKKGVCLEQSNGFYLLENREIGCYTCLLIGVRHPNVLQYQESFCIGKETLQRVCSTIHAETVQRTLVREPSASIVCPLQDGYYVSYNNNSGGFCRHPPSYVTPCASQSRLRFHFEQCLDVAYTHKRDVTLECLAAWRESSDEYMLGRLSGPGFQRKDDRYRCFMYRIYGTIVHAAMSADSSCRGLRSPRDGPVLMEFTQDVNGWPHARCIYPRWLTDRVWRDLDPRHTYRADEIGDIIRQYFRQSDQQTETLRSLRCHRVLTRNTTADEFVAVTFVSSSCSSSTKYMCIKFIRRKGDNIEMREGRFLDEDPDTCFAADMLEISRRLLLAETITSSRCPLEGRYAIHTGTTRCNSYFRSGCNGSSILDIISTCSSRPGLQLECLTSWQEDTKWFLIARLSTSTSGLANCYSFRQKGDTILFSSDQECNAGTPLIIRDRTTYAMDSSRSPCDYKTSWLSKHQETLLTAPSVHESFDIVGDFHQGGGGYKHVNATRQTRKEIKSRPEYNNIGNANRVYILFLVNGIVVFSFIYFTSIPIIPVR